MKNEREDDNPLSKNKFAFRYIVNLMYVFIFLVKVTEWPPIGKIAAHSAYEMFSWYKYLIVGLVFSRLGFWSGNLFLIAPFPDLCLLVPFFSLCCHTCNFRRMLIILTSFFIVLIQEHIISHGVYFKKSFRD